jgi:histidine triad (HIT) family protein
MTTKPDCVFCKVVTKEMPGNVVYQDEQVTAFRDLNPQMPVHVLIVPNTHVANTEELEPQHDAAVGAVIRAAREVAKREGVAESGYRLVVNTGRDAHNVVPHLHVHLVGGRAMGWPPG